MKQLTCEMCGGTNLVKQDGVFVCQSCGTKYSIEDARKMMVEGTVDVSGSTVKVDTSTELDNLYQIARRAKDENNSENAAKYYDMILVRDPTSWEATFFVVYFQAMQCKISEIRSAAVSVSNCESSVFNLIKDHVPSDEQVVAVCEVALRSQSIATELAIAAKKHYDNMDASIRNDHTAEYKGRILAARTLALTCGDAIDDIFDDTPELARIAADVWKVGLQIHELYLSSMDTKEKIQLRRDMLPYVDCIEKYDPAFSKQYKEKIIGAEKEIIEADIASLKRRIDFTEKENKKGWNWGLGSIGILCLGAFFILCAIGIGHLAFLTDSLDEVTLPVGFSFALGVLICWLAIVFTKPLSKDEKERNLKSIKNMQAQIQAKEAEIAAKDAEIEALMEQ